MIASKRMVDITRTEWIMYKWIEVTVYGDKERKFIRGYMRAPDEVIRAGKDWDEWSKHYKYLVRENNV
jgi:hypothetical protein